MSKCSLGISSARHVGITVKPSPSAKPASKYTPFTCPRIIRYHETGASDLCHDLIGDAANIIFGVYAERMKAGRSNTRIKPVKPCIAQAVIKPHRDEALRRA